MPPALASPRKKFLASLGGFYGDALGGGGNLLGPPPHAPSKPVPQYDGGQGAGFLGIPPQGPPTAPPPTEPPPPAPPAPPPAPPPAAPPAPEAPPNPGAGQFDNLQLGSASEGQPMPTGAHGGVKWGGQEFLDPRALVAWINRHRHGGHLSVHDFLAHHPGAAQIFESMAPGHAAEGGNGPSPDGAAGAAPGGAGDAISAYLRHHRHRAHAR